MYKISTNHQLMYVAAINDCMAYLVRNPSINSLHLGLSGGIDSAVTAAIARAVCDEMKRREIRPIKLYGHCLPIDSDEGEMIRAENVGHSFCNYYLNVDLEEALCGLAREIDFDLLGKHDDGVLTDHAHKVRWGNMKARVRMIYLYNQAAKHKGMVLSTDNLTEHMLGFWTLHGDVGDFGFIQNLWKTEVYGLADHIVGLLRPLMSEAASLFASEVASRRVNAMQRCIYAIPTDGLGVTESDFDQLYHPEWKEDMPDNELAERRWARHLYKQIDNTLIDILTGGKMKISPIGMARDRYHASKWKRDNPISTPRVYLT